VNAKKTNAVISIVPEFAVFEFRNVFPPVL